jgi:predicted amidohydrolase YtcJ
VEGGEIEVDTGGQPTGILKENAGLLISVEHGEDEEAEAAGAVREGCERLASLGLTTVHSVVDADEARLLDAASAQGGLFLNCVRMWEVHDLSHIEPLQPGRSAPFIKIFVDGALGSQTAAMLEPYCAQPDNTGIITTSRDDLEQMVHLSVEKGFGLAVHAIGDRAGKQVLDVYEEVQGLLPGSGAILRMEHAQVLRREDIPRFGALGVIASMQPIHLVGDMDVADRYWGERSRHAYAFGSIASAGGTIAFGSDAPIEDPDPLKGIHAAVTRLDPGRPGRPAWYPEERLTVAEALDCYTLNAAMAGGESDAAGSIRPGLRADFTVIEDDILAIPDPAAILETAVAMAVVRGEIVIPS